MEWHKRNDFLPSKSRESIVHQVFACHLSNIGQAETSVTVVLRIVPIKIISPVFKTNIFFCFGYNPLQFWKLSQGGRGGFSPLVFGQTVNPISTQMGLIAISVKSTYINVLSALKWQASLNSSLNGNIKVDSVKMTIFEVIFPHRKGLIAIGAI